MRFTRNTQFFAEIVKSLRKSERAEALEVGDGMLALKWSDDENFNIYFDTGRWKLTVPIVERYREVVFPPTLTNTGVITAYFLQRAMVAPEVVIIIAELLLIPTASHYRRANER